MARLLHNTDETLLKCYLCDILFRHEESDRAILYNDKHRTMWDSPCCHRRYSLLKADDPNEICAVITHGYRDRKSRDKYQQELIFVDKGIDWAWVDG